MQKTQLFDEIKHFLNTQVQGVLATLDGDQPCLHLMAYGFSDDLSELYLVSYADTRKVSNMLAQPKVSMLWDNRTGNSADHVDGLALNAVGQAFRLDETRFDDIKALLLRRNSTLKTLLSSDRAAIFSVSVSEYVYVKGYSEVYQLQP